MESLNDKTKHFTEHIPYGIAKKLKEAGMPLRLQVYCPDGGVASREEAGTAYYENQLAPYCTYADVFDWLTAKGYYISIVARWSYSNNEIMDYIGVVNCLSLDFVRTWHSAADAAIEKALELIK